MASEYLETIRSPLSRARAHVAAADANLIGIATALAAGDAVSGATIDTALARQAHARQEMDRAIYAALGTLTLDGRTLSPGDYRDMRAALFAALSRIEGRPAPIRTGYPEVGSFVG